MITVLPEKVKPTVVVLWDSMPDVKGKEDLSDKTQQVLAPRKWNKDAEGARRMDMNVEIVENTDEHEVMDLNDDGEGNGSSRRLTIQARRREIVKAIVTMNKIITSRCFLIELVVRIYYYINVLMGRIGCHQHGVMSTYYLKTAKDPTTKPTQYPKAQKSQL